MKKKYIQPSAKAYSVQTASVIATSPSYLNYSGPNNITGGPTAADAKELIFDDADLGDWDF